MEIFTGMLPIPCFKCNIKCFQFNYKKYIISSQMLQGKYETEGGIFIFSSFFPKRKVSDCFMQELITHEPLL